MQETPSPQGACDELVVETVRRHAERALAIARRCSVSSDDALEAYARALLKLVRYKRSLRAETAQWWFYEVVRREAALVRRQRGRLVAVDDAELHLLITDTTESAEERVLGLDVASRAGEALGALKTDEARALTLQAAGLSYREISARLGWSATKTNRALTEGRAGFRRRYAELESGDACRDWSALIAEGRGVSLAVRARLRAHLRGCAACRATARELHDTSAVLALVLPVALASAEAGDRASFVARVGETVGRSLDAVSGMVVERATGATVQLQAFAEAASAAKVAAVAASAVALTGGGVAVHEATRDEPLAPARAAERTTPTASTPAPPPTTSVVSTTPPPATTTAAPPPPPPPAPEFDDGGGGAATDEFAPPPPPPPPRPAAPEFGSSGGGEFGG